MPGPRGIEPGDAAPDFRLPNANSSAGAEQMSLTDVSRASGTVVLFTCNHCPYVVGSEERIEAIANKARGLDMGFVGKHNFVSNVYQSSENVAF